LLVSAGALSYYVASMVNFVLFTDKVLIVSALSNMGGHKIRRISKNSAISQAVVLCLAGRC